MLYFVLARTGGGKTTHVHNVIADFIRDGKRDIVLLVPEQYSFATERMMLEKLGAKQAAYVDVLSFSRLAQLVCTNAHGKGRHLQDCQRVLYMSLALEAVREQLQRFQKQAAKPSLAKEMLALHNEVRQSGLDASSLTAAAETMVPGLLRQKVTDIALVMQAYEAIAQENGYDEQDLMRELCEQLETSDYFRGKLVVLDAFYGFTGQELQVITQILKQAGVVYVTLCTDNLDLRQGEQDVFWYTKQTAAKLKRIAGRLGIPVAKPQYLSAFSKFNNFPPKYQRYTDTALSALERNLFAPDADIYPERCDAITLCTAADLAEECRFIAVSIKKLIREKHLRCRDMAVIVRRQESYEALLRSELKKCGLPVFEDERHSIAEHALMLLVRSAAEIAAGGFSADAILRFCKTGLAGLPLTAVSELENYAFLWRLSGSQWVKPFTKHPRGYTDAWKPQDIAALEQLNTAREKVMAPLLRWKELAADTDAPGYAGGLYDLLTDCGAAQSLKQLAEELDKAGETALALYQNRVWETLMELLDAFAGSLEGRRCSPARFRELFELMLTTVTLGSVPQGLDEITVGSADRIRPLAPRYVFVAGLNEDVFPELCVTGGTFSDKDRQILADAGVELSVFGAQRFAQERLYVYNALCCARDAVFLSCRLQDGTGDSLAPSSVFLRVQELFPQCQTVSAGKLPPSYFAQGADFAFEQLALHYQKKDTAYTTLREVLQSRPGFGEKLKALDRAASEAAFSLSDRDTAEALFGNPMRMSASRAETYHKCAFQYFCQYGLRAYPRKRAELDPLQRGSMLHDVMEFLLGVIGLDTLEQASEQERTQLIRGRIQLYGQTVLSAQEDDLQLLNILERHVQTLSLLLERLLQERRQSSFEPVDFELEIGGEGGIAPYCLELEDGRSLQLAGKIDRVDIAEIDGKRYVRIVDYKSTDKSLELQDVLNGISLQMFLYLFALERNGIQRYGDLEPAGVLYQKAAKEALQSERGTDSEKLKNAHASDLKPKGWLLKNMSILQAMEHGLAGLYIPAKLSSKGELSGSLITLTQLGALHQKVDDLLTDMLRALYEGNIAARPLLRQSGATPFCAMCDYQSVCLTQEESPKRSPCLSTNKEVLELLDSGKKEGECIGKDGMDDAAESGD